MYLEMGVAVLIYFQGRVGGYCVEEGMFRWLLRCVCHGVDIDVDMKTSSRLIVQEVV